MEDKNKGGQQNTQDCDNVAELQSIEQEKKRKKRLLIIFFVIGFFIVGTIGTIAILKINSAYNNTSATNFVVVVDPQVITGSGATHLNGAQRFCFEDIAKKEADNGVHNMHIETQINYGQYLCYVYTFINNGNKDMGVVLDLTKEVTNNSAITYSIDNGEEKVAVDRLYNTTLKPKTTQTIRMYVRVVDVHQEAYVKGVLTLSLVKMGGK